MEYGLMVTNSDAQKLEEVGIEWTYWDVESALQGELPERFEIIFNNQAEMKRAKQVLA